MPDETNGVKAGEGTSEFKETHSAGVWGKVMIVCGIITTTLGPLLVTLHETLGETSKIVVIGGFIVTVAGAILKLGSSAAYSKARADVKAAASLSEKKGE